MPAQVLVDARAGLQVRWVPVVCRLVLNAQVDQDSHTGDRGGSNGCEDLGLWPLSPTVPIPKWGPGASLHLMASPPIPSSLGTASSLSPDCTLLSLLLSWALTLGQTFYFVLQNLISMTVLQPPYEVETLVTPFAHEETKAQNSLVTCERLHDSEKAPGTSGTLHRAAT